MDNLDDKLKADKNFKLQGRKSFQGLDIAVENRPGSIRSGLDNDGEEWETRMFYEYGYIRGTLGVDGEQVDCYVGKNADSQKVFIIHQKNPETGKYDEDKVMLGFTDKTHARDAYLAHYDSHKFLGEITEMTIDELKEKLKTRKGKMIKSVSIFGKKVLQAFEDIFKSVKVRDLLTMNMFDAANPDDEVTEGKTVVKNGKTYEYRRSQKNPGVRRLFSTEQDEPAQPDLFQTAPKIAGPTPKQAAALGEHEPVDQAAMKEATKRTKLFGQQVSLFDQQEEPKTAKSLVKITNKITGESAKPDEKITDKIPEEEHPETIGDDLFSQPAPSPKKKEDEENPTMAFGAEAIDKNVVKKRQEINAKALELLKTKKPEEMTMDDKIILAQYSGRGGLGGNTFDDISLNEYYTRTQEAQFIWDMLGKFGFKGGPVLEPSSGVGVFIHTAPKDTIVDGVELDKTSSAIASILHGQFHNITNQSFEQHIKGSDGGKYAAVVGNPPFGPRGMTSVDDPEKIDLNTCQEYFLDRGIDELEEGGLLGMIVPTGIMDNQVNEWRLSLNKKADFLGAIRMPTGVFKHAKAQVTTDIVFFRKRDDAVRDYLENVPKEDLKGLYDAQILDAEFIAGNYFEKNPQYALGTKKRGQWEGQSIWTGDISRGDLDEVGALLKFTDRDAEYQKLGILIDRLPAKELHVGDTKTFNGRTYRLNENHRWERVDEAELGKESLPKELQEKLGIKTKAEFQALQRDVAKKLELTREQLNLLDDKVLSSELEAYNDKNDFRAEMLKHATLLGLAVKKFQIDLRSGAIEGSDAQKEAAKLAGLLNQFHDKYGHPINDLKLKRYLGRTTGNPILYLAGSFNEDGGLSAIFDDPLAYYAVYRTNYEVGELDSKSIPKILQYLVDNGLDTSFESIQSMYSGGTIEENELIRDENVFIDENGGYSPTQEVCVGTVYNKLDAWTKMRKDISEKLSTPAGVNEPEGEGKTLSDDEKETLLLKDKKLEDQIFEMKRRAGSTELTNLPVSMKDAGEFFDIKHLNEYLSGKLGANFVGNISRNKEGFFGMEDQGLQNTYLMYATKGAEGQDKYEKDQRNRSMEAYFGKENLNPPMFLFLNMLNGLSVRGANSLEFKKQYEDIANSFVKYLDSIDEAPAITDIYNRAFNDFIQKKYDDSVIEGLNHFAYDKVVATDKDGKEFTVRDKIGSHVWEVVRRMYDQGKGIIAHGVGLGKTVTAIALIALSKATGRCKKPVVIMPKSLQLNWVNEINKWTEGSKILPVGLKQVNGVWKDCNAQETILQLQQIQNEDWDYILITRDDFKRIDFNPETKKRMIKEIADKYYPEGDEMTKLDKQKREVAIQQLAKTMQNDTAFENVFLENLGLDMMVRDEAHDCKNLLQAVQTDIKGIGNAAAAISMHNFFASKIIRGANNEKGVFSMTATPISNSPLEVFNMMLPVMEKELEAINIKTMDDFVEKFADHGMRMTADADGKVGEKDMFSGWKVPDALRKIFYRFTDFKTKDDVESVRSSIKFPKERPSNLYSTLNAGQEQLSDHCSARLNCLKYREQDPNTKKWNLKDSVMTKDIEEEVLTEQEKQDAVHYFYNQFIPTYEKLNRGRSPEDPPIDDCFFSIQSDLIKISSDLDWYAGNRSYYSKDIDESFVEKYNDLDKYKQLTEHAAGLYNSGKKQLIFAINTTLHPIILDNLIKAGIKPSEIAIVNGKTAKNAQARSKFSEGFNSGKYKVIIGNYATMGEGLNFNKECAAITHVQPAWNYAQIEQGNGRGIRQGNDLDFVDTYYMLTKGSIDTFMTDKIMKKGGMVSKFLKGELSEWNEDVQLDGDEMLAARAKNPERARKILERRNAAIQEAKKEKNRVINFQKFDRLFEVKAKMSKFEDQNSKQYKMLEQEQNEIMERLNNDPEFKLKDHLTSDQKPIVIRNHDVAIPVGSVVKYSNHPDEANEFAVLTDYTPSTGRVLLTTYSSDTREIKSMPVESFISQYGWTVKKTDLDVAGMFKTLVDKENLIDMGMINAMPIDALNANRKQLLQNLRDVDYAPPLMYKNMNGEIKFDVADDVFQTIEEDGGKVLFPQEYPDWVKVASQIIKSKRDDSKARGFCRAIYGDNWEKELPKAVKKLTNPKAETNTTPQDKFEIPDWKEAKFNVLVKQLENEGYISPYDAHRAVKEKSDRLPSEYLMNRILQGGLSKKYIADYENAENKEEFLQRNNDRMESIIALFDHGDDELKKWHDKLKLDKWYGDNKHLSEKTA